jgi:hypothetical protein
MPRYIAPTTKPCQHNPESCYELSCHSRGVSTKLGVVSNRNLTGLIKLAQLQPRSIASLNREKSNTILSVVCTIFRKHARRATIPSPVGAIHGFTFGCASPSGLLGNARKTRSGNRQCHFLYIVCPTNVLPHRLRSLVPLRPSCDFLSSEEWEEQYSERIPQANKAAPSLSHQALAWSRPPNAFESPAWLLLS